MKKQYAYDLVVVGGGTAGAFSAIAAARSGVKTAVIERNSYLGGMATGSGLTEMNAAGFQAAPLYKGLEKEIFDEMIAAGDAEYHFAVPMSSNPDVKIDRLRYNPEMLKILLEAKAVESGVALFYDTELDTAAEGEEGCTLTAHSPYEEMEFSCRYLIDATGNADLVQKLGGETIKTEAEKQLVATLMFRISNVDLKKLDDFIHSEDLKKAIAEGYEAGILKGKILAFTPIPGSRDVSLNVTRAKFDYEDTEATSAGLVEARSQILPVFQFVKKRVPGLEESYISNIAPMIGVRDGRRIRARYMLTLEDLDQMVSFEDDIACGCYPMDIHDPVTNSVIWKILPGVYHIPYRSILPVGLHRTLTVGKCLGSEKQAFAAIRVMPIMMNVGESAGYAVALALKGDQKLDEVPAPELTACLKEKYDG